MDAWLNIGYGLGFGTMAAGGIISISHFFGAPEKRYTKMYASDRPKPQTEAEEREKAREDHMPFMELNEIGTVVSAFGALLFGWLSFRSLSAVYAAARTEGDAEGILAYQGLLAQVILAVLAGFVLTLYIWRQLRKEASEA